MKHIKQINTEQAKELFEEMRNITSPADLIRETFNTVIYLYQDLNGEGDEKVTVEQMREKNGTVVPNL